MAHSKEPRVGPSRNAGAHARRRIGAMRTDRRGFFRILGGAVASVSGTVSAARAAKGSLEIHRETRNTRLGALGPRRPELQSVPLPFKPYPEAERVEAPRSGVRAPCSRWPRPSRATWPTRRLRRSPFLSRSWGGCSISRTASPASSRPEARPSCCARRRLRERSTQERSTSVAERVQGLAKGVYYYDVANHALARLRPGSLLGEVARAPRAPGRGRETPRPQSF